MATAKLMETRVFSEINVQDICDQAEVAKGTFYIQFKTKEDIIRALFEEFIAFEYNSMPYVDPETGAFRSMCLFVGWYERTFRINAGLMRSFVRLSDLDEEVAALWTQRNNMIVQRGISNYLLQTRFEKDRKKLALLAIRTVGGIMDYTLFARHGIHQASDFTADFSDDELIQFHSLLMYRCLYGEDPPKEDRSSMVEYFIDRAQPATA
ncbi:TetR/AcrR family transcriptional regulator [Alterisphingorhabdus coralli]|uniref:TetR/AcrR family transcriptional regulator n=1 Tax=Alterisphingorhabdus coralli TaxID=3071408 RepID=A0AA97F6V3_9SPHN|nr:TetR/AcrR family transcriptional regulator [Parasphingorhabdus sp. SCSIO 66989]WOE75494.1 TetR/AcrR family transcriptional regulator [Parasphingorhabdus sp. SCSIO 66989]